MARALGLAKMRAQVTSHKHVATANLTSKLSCFFLVNELVSYLIIVTEFVLRV